MALNVFDLESWDVLSARLIELARAAGAFAMLPFALMLRLNKHLFAGEFDAAAALNAEAGAIAEATGRPFLASYGIVALAAWQGRERTTENAIAAAASVTASQGARQWVAAAQWSRAVLYNGLGRFDDALVAAEQSRASVVEPGLTGLALLEVIEAAALSGNQERAAAALAELAELTQACDSAWALASVARARALAEPEATEPSYREALARAQTPA